MDVYRTKPVVSTGSDELDNKVGGGIPLGSLTLIEGGSHSGKSVFSQQLLWGSLRDGYRISLFTSENTVKSLMRQMDSLNLNVQTNLLLGHLRVYPMEVSKSQEEALESLLSAIKSEAKKERDLIFVDALTPFISGSPAGLIIGYFEQCKRLCSNGTTVVTIIHSHAVDQDLLVRIQSLCDAHLRLRTENAGSKLIKIMEVAKIRGASKNTGNIISFEIEPGIGMRIIPISKAQG
ncbi:MAG: flagellar accessory protein FlaH [Anaerolineae bacterium]|jgi:flagellar protein FlaH|nr:flagellar accessory protein FlaH [Anaerolineae bacterium]